MIELLAFVGVPVYIVVVWAIWSNKKDAGTTEIETFTNLMHDERQEFVFTVLGAMLFAFGGEGLLDSVCDVIEYFFNSDAHDLCTSIQVNNEELFYILGGATMGTASIFGIKLAKKKAKKKLDNV